MNETRAFDILPEALHIDREDWESHPHFPEQSLLLQAHASFRRKGVELIRRAEDGSLREGIAWLFRVWKGAMHAHEYYEEHKLYPYIEARWGYSMQSASDGHEELAEREHAVFEALNSATDNRQILTRALREHQDVLCRHLDLEEELVLPALLELDPDEFEDYLHSDIRGLLQRLAA